MKNLYRIFFLIAVLCLVSCSKDDLSQDETSQDKFNELNERVAQLGYIKIDNIPEGVTLKNFKSVDQALKYFDEIEKVRQLEIVSKITNIGRPPCPDSGSHTFGQSLGMGLSMTGSFDWQRGSGGNYSVSNINASSSGFSMGHGYEYESSSNAINTTFTPGADGISYEGMSMSVYGTEYMGVTMDGVPLSYEIPITTTVNFDPCSGNTATYTDKGRHAPLPQE